MHIARVVALVSLAVTAGCLGGPAGPATGSQGPAESPSATASPFPEGTVTLPDGPKEAPERPDELTRDSVADYVQTYEYRYAYNSLWYSEYSDVEVDCEIDDVENVSAGWTVTVSCTGYSNTGGERTGTATPTEVHADWETQTLVYHVDEDSVIRQRAED